MRMHGCGYRIGILSLKRITMWLPQVAMTIILLLFEDESDQYEYYCNVIIARFSELLLNCFVFITYILSSFFTHDTAFISSTHILNHSFIKFHYLKSVPILTRSKRKRDYTGCPWVASSCAASGNRETDMYESDSDLEFQRLPTKVVNIVSLFYDSLLKYSSKEDF